MGDIATLPGHRLINYPISLPAGLIGDSGCRGFMIIIMITKIQNNNRESFGDELFALIFIISKFLG